MISDPGPCPNQGNTENAPPCAGKDNMTNTTIDGFKVEMSSDELKAHFQVRLGHHEKALNKLAVGKLVLVGQDGSTDTSELVQQHKTQVKMLSFLVAHMPVAATFRLTMQELAGLYVLDEIVN